jgi:hypothetical protein
MGILNIIFPRSFPRHDSVPSFISDAITPYLQKTLEEVTNKLKSNQVFTINFQRPDKTRISIDFTSRKLNIDVFYPNGSRSEFKTTDSYMGAVQWGGGINFYKPDGSFEDGGVYPRKFNTALDVFNYTMEKLHELKPSKPEKKRIDRDSVSALHQPLVETDLKLVETILESCQVINPKEVAKVGVLPKVNLGDEEFVLKRLTNGRLLESLSRKIFLNNNNIYHYRLIDKLDNLVDRDTKAYGTPSELGEIMGVKGMLTTKAQPFFEADGITLVKEKKPKLLTKIPSNLALAA